MAISTIEEIKQKKKERQEEIELSSGIRVLVEKPDTSRLLAENILDNKILEELFKNDEKKEEINEENLEEELLGDLDNVKNFHQLMIAYAQITLVEPKWEEIEEYLSDVDKAEIGTWGLQKVTEDQVGIERFQESNDDR